MVNGGLFPFFFFFFFSQWWLVVKWILWLVGCGGWLFSFIFVVLGGGG